MNLTIKNISLVLLILFILPLNILQAQQKEILESKGQFVLPNLLYGYESLEPVIDRATMEIHYNKHHLGYINNLNKLIENSNFSKKSLKEIFSDISNAPIGIRNNAGGHYNHSLYWKILTKPKDNNIPKGHLLDLINKNFENFDNFKKQFNEAGLGLFGSGWVWLIQDSSGKLIITTTTNQDNPLMDTTTVQGKPILGIDVWEHAYYLKYQNKRADYLNNIWSIINWEEVERLLKEEL